MHTCTKCVLNDKFPRIAFDEKGVCNYCRTSKNKEIQKKQRIKYEKRFLELVSKHKGKSSYDCLVAFSGGKDSSYTLHLMKNKYRLNSLAYSFDNWFQSEKAQKNIRKLVQHLNIDHWTMLPNYKTFKQIMHIAISHDLYSPKTLERASNICTTCLSLIRYIGFSIAIEKEIPFVIFGLSPGQAPIVTSVFKTNPEMIRKMQNAIYKPLHNFIGEDINSYFLGEKHFKKKDSFPYSINPLAFSEYNENQMVEKIKTFGWERPDDTDANSTNCLLNALANQLHLEKYGYNPYALEIAELVRNGTLSREEGLQRLTAQFSEEHIKFAKGELGI